MKWKYYIRWGMALLLGMGTTACSDTAPTGTVEEQPLPQGRYYLNLTFRMAEGRESRANDMDTPTMPAVDSEDRIHSLHVFFTDAENQWQVRRFDVDDLSDSGKKEYRVPLDAPLSEEMEMYLGANLNAEQEWAFLNKNEVYKLKNNANDLSPYSIGYENTEDTRSSIAMFCIEGVKPQKVADEDNEYNVNFSLKRLVAKVLLTCKVDQNVEGVEYVSLKKDFQGWIRRDSVRYLVNVRNRSTYIKQKVNDNTDTDANVDDPNMELTPYIAAFDSDEAEKSSYWDLVNTNFVYIDPLKQYDESASYFRQALTYDDERMDEYGEKPYYEGIYCPENTFLFNSSDDEDKLKNHEEAWGMITHVSVMAKFTPRVLNVEYGLFDYISGRNDFTPEIKVAVEKLRPSYPNTNLKDDDVVPVDCGTEAVAQAFLEASLRKYGMLGPADKNQFQNGTFFVHDENGSDVYYTYGAARIKYDGFDPSDLDNLGNNLGNYIPHQGGWGYYYTYIDNRSEDNKTEEFTFYKHGQVERNRYYILTVNSFSNPGSSVVNPNYIEVNTRVEGWTLGGSGSIILE